MYEYIKRTDAINEINRGDLLVGNGAEWAREIIWRCPYSDVREVKHGYWIARHVYCNTTYICSRCKAGSMQETNYCPHCGSKMDGDYWHE